MSIPFIQLNISPVTQEKLQSSDVTNKMQLAQGRAVHQMKKHYRCL